MCEVANTIEVQTCGRCGGSGHYSYCQSYGTTCFRCAGSGRTYTKRGLATVNMLKASRSLPAGELLPGMKLRGNDRKYRTILTVTTEESCWSSIVDGVRVPGPLTAVITTTGNNEYRHDVTAAVECSRGAEHHAATWAAAMAYQASLTKQGKLPKRLAKLAAAVA